MRGIGWPAYAAVVAVAFALGVWASSVAIARLRIADPGCIVWDEFVGQWIALLPFTLLGMDTDPILAGVAFGLFRLFDIWKPWPVRWVDREVHGGLGAMLDDALAGAIACGVFYGAIVGALLFLGLA